MLMDVEASWNILNSLGLSYGVCSLAVVILAWLLLRPMLSWIKHLLFSSLLAGLWVFVPWGDESHHWAPAIWVWIFDFSQDQQLGFQPLYWLLSVWFAAFAALQIRGWLTTKKSVIRNTATRI